MCRCRLREYTAEDSNCAKSVYRQRISVGVVDAESSRLNRLFLGDTVLVANSTKSSEELERIDGKSPSDHVWLITNACRVQVTENMFIP